MSAFKFTAIVNAADRDGMAQDYAIHFTAASAEAMAGAVEDQWEKFYGDGSWQDRAAEVTNYISGWVQVHQVLLGVDGEEIAAARSAFSYAEKERGSHDQAN